MTNGSFRIGVLASHEGTTLQAVVDATQSGAIAGRVSVVISNNSGSGALRRATNHGIAAVHLSSGTHPSPEALDAAICRALMHHGSDLVLLAGYMKKLGPETLRTFRGRILNTHPALLPQYGGQGMYGMNVHRAVIAAKALQSGASVHYVDREYDTGPVLAQVVVPVLPNDTPETLAARVQERERELLVRVLGEIASGRRPLAPEPD